MAPIRKDHHDHLEAGLLPRHNEKSSASQQQPQQPCAERRRCRARKFIAPFILCCFVLYTITPVFSSSQLRWVRCPHASEASQEISVQEDVVKAVLADNFVVKVEKRQGDATGTLTSSSDNQSNTLPGLETSTNPTTSIPPATSEPPTSSEPPSSSAPPTSEPPSSTAPTTSNPPPPPPTSTETSTSSDEETTSTTSTSESDTKPITTTKASSSPIRHTFTSTLPNGGTTTITSTSWVGVDPTDTEGPKPTDANLQNSAPAKSLGSMASLVIAFGMGFMLLI